MDSLLCVLLFLSIALSIIKLVMLVAIASLLMRLADFLKSLSQDLKSLSEEPMMPSVDEQDAGLVDVTTSQVPTTTMYEQR